MPPAVEAQSLNHWTTREVPILYIVLRIWCTLKFEDHGVGATTENIRGLGRQQLQLSQPLLGWQFTRPVPGDLLTGAVERACARGTWVQILPALWAS